MDSTTIPSLAGTLAVLLLVSVNLPAPGAEDPKSEPKAEETGGKSEDRKPLWQPAKRIWAHDLLWSDAPKLEVGKWLTKEPELEGKYILVEFWRTWCGACRRMSPLMNELHRKYGDELVVIGITGEPVDKVKAALPGWKKEYYLAIDKPRPQAAAKAMEAPAPAGESATEGDQPDVESEDRILRPEEQGAYEAQFGVWGWPHAVLLEPEYHAVIWQGFPGLKGYELTVEKVGQYLERGRQAKKKEGELR